jgi:hypothetical protein
VSDLLSLPLVRLERPIKIRSRVLDTELWVVPPGVDRQRFDAPVYTAEECRAILALDLSPAELRAVHLAKILFEGDLLLPAEADERRGLYLALLRRYRNLENHLGDRASQTGEAELLQVAGHLSRLLDQTDTLDHDCFDLSRIDPEKGD